MAGGEVGEPVGPAHRLHVVHVAAAAEVATVRQVDLKLATTSANRVTEEYVCDNVIQTIKSVLLIIILSFSRICPPGVG